MILNVYLKFEKLGRRIPIQIASRGCSLAISSTQSPNPEYACSHADDQRHTRNGTGALKLCVAWATSLAGEVARVLPESTALRTAARYSRSSLLPRQSLRPVAYSLCSIGSLKWDWTGRTTRPQRTQHASIRGRHVSWQCELQYRNSYVTLYVYMSSRGMCETHDSCQLYRGRRQRYRCSGRERAKTGGLRDGDARVKGLSDVDGFSTPLRSRGIRKGTGTPQCLRRKSAQ